jgi:hypothetical protein
MLSHKANFARGWILAALFLLLGQTRLLGQEILAEDSTRIVHGLLTHHVEAGFNALGAGLEYRYQWFPFLSSDVMASLSKPGVAFGVTFSPMWIFFLQGVVGAGSYEAAVATDGPPPFKPTYLYGWNAGFRFPLAPKKTRVYFIFAFGQLKYVENHYHYNGGGFLIGPPPTALYRTETRVAEVFSIGLGMSF